MSDRHTIFVHLSCDVVDAATEMLQLVGALRAAGVTEDRFDALRKAITLAAKSMAAFDRVDTVDGCRMTCDEWRAERERI